jgi:hypothetical protein
MPTPAALSKSKEVPVEPTPEVRLREAWQRYGGLFYFICGVLALAVLARGGWRYLNDQKELAIQKEYSECVTPDSYLAFAVKHPGHPLAGIAEETVADNSYSSGKYLDALKAYSSATTDLPEGPLRSHAKLGQAMSLEMTGRTGEAEADLRALMDDAGQMKAIRCEAGYHLAGIEIAAGRGSEVSKIAEQLIKIDPANGFAERTYMLRPPGSDAVSPAGTVTVPGVTAPAKP